jgi:hypothetical protein
MYEWESMKTIQVFDPPMCCSTGVCGPTVDSKLVRFSSDLHWVANHRVRVERFNLSQQPQAFAAHTAVRTELHTNGNDCLPLILVDGLVVSRGVYPDREHLASFLGLSEEFACETAALPKSALPGILS